MDTEALRGRIEEHVRRHALIEPGGEVCCLVSGGADSTCLWHALRALGYRVSALHVNHRLRGDASEEDARFCAEALGAEVVVADGAGLNEEQLREARYAVARDRLRATGHTPPTRSRRSSTDSSPAARRRGWRRAGRTASSIRC